MISGQPSQIDFENALAIQFLKLEREPASRLVVEDESHAIGSLSVPFSLYGVMKQAPIALIQESLEKRADTILNDYIRSNLAEFQRADAEQAFKLFSEYLLNSLDRIQRRLGGDRHVVLSAMMRSALAEQAATGDTERHREWIGRLLEDYYDPMYRFQLSRRLDRVIFRGSGKEFLEWEAASQVPATA
jgi:tRNA 2-selenouridine synthase